MAPIQRKRRSGRCLWCSYEMPSDAKLSASLTRDLERAADLETQARWSGAAGRLTASVQLVLAHLRGYCNTLCEQRAREKAMHEDLRRLVFIGLLHCELRPADVAHGGES